MIRKKVCGSISHGRFRFFKIICHISLFTFFHYSACLVSKSSSAFPIRRVSSFTDLRDVKAEIKSDLKQCKSEGNISSIELAPSLDGSQWPEVLFSNNTGQQLHASEKEIVEIQTTSEETVIGYLWYWC